MKKNRETIIGLGILLVGFLVGICVAIFVVENNFHSNASNDGWLGFLGGLFGSFISGMITFYILYINRKDADEEFEKNKKQIEDIQLENSHEFYQNMKQQSAILKYQCNMRICDDVMKLISELIKIAEDYYVNVADNTYGHYLEKRFRTSEICSILEMKLSGVEDSTNFVMQTKSYQRIFVERKPPYKDQKEKRDEIKRHSEGLRQMAIELCSNMLATDELY